MLFLILTNKLRYPFREETQRQDVEVYFSLSTGSIWCLPSSIMCCSPYLYSCLKLSFSHIAFFWINVFSPSEPSEGDALLAMGMSLFIASVGLAIIYFQCLKLRQQFHRIRERRRQTRHTQASNLQQSSLRDVCGEARMRQEESVQLLKAELESMKELHATVKAQVEGLHQLLGRITGEDGVPYGNYRGLDEEKENLITLQDSHEEFNQRPSQVHSKFD